jgi:anti-sigma factor RsiW
MNHEDREPLIGAYVDGELELSAALELERHLASCASCTATLQELRTLRTSLMAKELRYAPPSGLDAAVRRQLRASRTGEDAPAANPRAWRWAISAMAFAALTLAIFFMIGRPPASLDSKQDELADQVVASHIRSLMAAHLFDIASTDQHTVKPWFDGKVDYGPPVTDFAAQGFPLIGGRLDYLDNRPVAAMVYRRFKHVINLFVWPVDSHEPADSPRRSITRRGYHVVYWDEGGMTYWAVSDVNPHDLDAFAALVSQQSTPSPPER